MSDPENFIARWSRLKRETREEQKDPGAASPPPKSDDDAATGEPRAAAGAPEPAQEPPFDVASLPSIESLTGSSDIRAFLQSGVPAELTKAALRKVWTADPAIRDFIGLAENQWDFTDPAAMPGFGPLEATDDVGRLVAQAMGKLGEAAKFDPVTDSSSQAEPAAVPAKPSTSVATVTAQPLGVPERKESSAPQNQDVAVQHEPASAAMQQEEPPTKVATHINRRTHGRALPR